MLLNTLFGLDIPWNVWRRSMAVPTIPNSASSEVDTRRKLPENRGEITSLWWCFIVEVKVNIGPSKLPHPLVDKAEYLSNNIKFTVI